MLYLYFIAGAALLISFFADRQKTLKAFRLAYKKFVKILPPLLLMVLLVSFLPSRLSDTTLLKYLGHENGFIAVPSAALLGSITMLPGFIAFPLSRILLEKGAPYMVLSAFTTTLMMVGVLTYPLERAYLGHKVTIIRNLMSFAIALVVALMTGMFFGEVF